ncbi:hypothetical protein DVH05_004319 [Phytophthora capsici]|nr:hypothetical protein DVH05_004319 [Phytophthora capsici]
MSLIGSSTTAATTGFTSGPPTYGGFGPPVGCGSFGVDVTPPPTSSESSRSRLWVEDASEPFGRVENTTQCFARNGESPSTSKWTPPKPPSHPLFQSIFHSNASNTTPLFGHSVQQQPTPSNGGFAFGCKSNAMVNSAGKGETTSLFGPGSTVDHGLGESRMVFNSGSGETRTVFGLSSSSAPDPGRTVFGTASTSIDSDFGAGTLSPFAKSTQQVEMSSNNPFARISSSNANPFKVQSSTFAARVSGNKSVNPFARSPSNPFTAKKASNASTSHQNSSGYDKNLFAVPWLTTAGSASIKFKSGLRPAFSLKARPWRTSSQQQLVASEPLPSFGWGKKTALTQQSNEPTSEDSSIEAKSNSLNSSSSPANSAPKALVASPDSDPYGSGSFGAGLVEQRIKTAIANPPSSVELNLLSGRSEPASISRQQPSARFASRLGLARQPLQAIPMRPVSRFPSHKRRTAPSIARSQLPRPDSFCFSSSFSRLAISKKALRIQAGGSSKPVVAVPDDESGSTGEYSDEDKVKVSISPLCPVLRNKEYCTEPSMNELQQLTDDELSCVKNFVISRRDCGKIAFVVGTDVRGLQLDELVSFSDGEIVVYPDDSVKPAIGSGLNKPAIVNLCGISAGENESHENFLKRLELHTQKLGATFIGYEDGVWRFRVEHF